MVIFSRGWMAASLVLVLCTARLAAEERRESFDRDPHWDGLNHRSEGPEPRRVEQDFGYSPTNHAGGKAAGEIGGLVTPDAKAAWYAKKIPTATFDDRLTASGTLACTGRHFNALLGFFNSETTNEWRTPNTIAIRLYGRGDVFYAYVEYMTSRWRAGADSPGGFPTVADPETGRDRLAGFASGRPHTWSLQYDPDANGGQGSVTVTIDNQTAVCHLTPGHKQDGARFNRFGLLNIVKHSDTGGELWVDDVVINGEGEPFDGEPGWEALNNRREFVTSDVRPRFNFGFSPTHFAGGAAAGELGGHVFRGDCRYPERLAYYGDRVDELTLGKPLQAAGKVAMRRGVSDSTTLIGFFHSRESVAVTQSQSSGIPQNFLGVSIEGPSSEGFFFYPMYRFQGGASGYADGPDRPRILPNGDAHDWTFAYSPGAAGRPGRVKVTLDGQSVSIDLPESAGEGGTTFDRFGLVTTWIDGNGQYVYFDDLVYTCRQR
ncbi:MAG: hypothetical protein WD847_09060 [Pirellulales bacterium]